jgi:NAD(P)-dependent dehydrogenase (short-subunit alcohol dehydrogenase family)
VAAEAERRRDRDRGLVADVERLGAVRDVVEVQALARVLEPEQLTALADELRERWGRVDGVLHAIAFAPEDALGDRAYEIPISSLKSSIGHLLGAAGAVEAVATILALRDRIAPPTLGLENPGEGLDLDYVPGSAKPLDIGDKRAIAISSSFGFGGHNAVLALEAA